MTIELKDAVETDELKELFLATSKCWDVLLADANRKAQADAAEAVLKLQRETANANATAVNNAEVAQQEAAKRVEQQVIAEKWAAAASNADASRVVAEQDRDAMAARLADTLAVARAALADAGGEKGEQARRVLDLPDMASPMRKALQSAVVYLKGTTRDREQFLRLSGWVLQPAGWRRADGSTMTMSPMQALQRQVDDDLKGLVAGMLADVAEQWRVSQGGKPFTSVDKKPVEIIEHVEENRVDTSASAGVETSVSVTGETVFEHE